MLLGNTKIIEVESNLTLEEKSENLKKLYDVINAIAERLFYEGKDVSQYFLTEEELQQIDEKNFI